MRVQVNGATETVVGCWVFCVVDCVGFLCGLVGSGASCVGHGAVLMPRFPAFLFARLYGFGVGCRTAAGSAVNMV